MLTFENIENQVFLCHSTSFNFPFRQAFLIFYYQRFLYALSFSFIFTSGSIAMGNVDFNRNVLIYFIGLFSTYAFETRYNILDSSVKGF